jgi:hypothetical protein
MTGNNWNVQLLKGSTGSGQTTEKHYSSCGSKEGQCICVIEYALKDSIQLTPVKNQFYRSNTVHLYHKTEAFREEKDPLFILTAVFHKMLTL